MSLVYKNMLCMILFSVLLFSCVPPQSSRNIIEKEESWKIYEFKNIRIRLNAPHGIHWVENTYKETPSLYIELSPVKPPKGIIDDTFYRVKIVVKRTTEWALEKEKERILKSNLYKNSDESSKKKWQWMFKIHQEFDWISDGEYTYFRKDVLLDKEKVLSANAEVLYLNKNDEIIVKRILDSIEPF